MRICACIEQEREYGYGIRQTGGLYGESDLASSLGMGNTHCCMDSWSGAGGARPNALRLCVLGDLGPQQARLIQMSRDDRALSPRRFFFIPRYPELITCVCPHGETGGRSSRVGALTVRSASIPAFFLFPGGGMGIRAPRGIPRGARGLSTICTHRPPPVTRSFLWPMGNAR